jgi:hypothetical protein
MEVIRMSRQTEASRAGTGVGGCRSVAAHSADRLGAEVAGAFPRIRIAVNHTGFPWDRSEAGLELWRKGMEALARQPNVFVKGLGVRAQGPAMGVRFEPARRARPTGLDVGNGSPVDSCESFE